MPTVKGLGEWACEGEWQEAENTEYTGHDERCGDCRGARSHTWNQHHRQVRSSQ